jgi:hypothetical protein
MPGVWLSADAVPDAGHSGDDPGFAEAFAQCRDRDAHGVGERVGVLVPCPFQELFGADDTTFGGDENFEHGELLPGGCLLIAGWHKASGHRTLIVAATFGQPGTAGTILPNALQAGHNLVLALDRALGSGVQSGARDDSEGLRHRLHHQPPVRRP